MNFLPGPMELVLILIIVAMLFGVGKLPEVFGAVGKGIKEFRKEAGDELSPSKSTTAATSATSDVPAAPVATTVVPSAAVSSNDKVDTVVQAPQ